MLGSEKSGLLAIGVLPTEDELGGRIVKFRCS